MFKRVFLAVAMLLALIVPTGVSAEEAQDVQEPQEVQAPTPASPADVAPAASAERVTKYWLGSFEKYGDSSRTAQGHIQKVLSPEGVLSYRVTVADYIPSYRGDMIPENGTVEVWNPGTEAVETFELTVLANDTNGYGTYHFTFSLPTEVVDYQRENFKTMELGDEKRKVIFKFNAHNSVGHHVPFECKSDFSYAMEYGM